MTTLSDTNFPTGPRPTYPTAAEVESYRVDARAHSMREAREQLVDGSRTLAFLALVKATEAEFKITGPSSARIPVMDVLRRLPAKRVRTAVS